MIAATVLLFASRASAESPDVTALYRMGVQRGQSADVRVVGKLGSRPIQVWSSTDAITVTVPDEGDALTITAAEDAPAGIHWLRLHNAEGASALRPFVVGTLPEVVEQEANDFLEKANDVDAAGVVANGVLAKNGDVDSWAVELNKGQTLVAALDAHHDLGSPMDAVLQIVGDRGFVLDQNDDARGNDPRLVFECPRDGRYVVRVFAFPETPTSSIRLAGGEDYVYRLTLTTGPYVDHVDPLAVTQESERLVEPRGWNHANLAASATTIESNRIVAPPFSPADSVDIAVVDHPSLDESTAVTQPVDVPITITGHIAGRGEVDEFSFRSAKGDKLEVRIESRTLGFPLDAAIEIRDELGKSLKVVDDPKREEFDPVVSFDAPADGTYRVRVRDVFEQFGPRHAYRLTVDRRRPDFAVELATDRFVVAAGTSVKIPVTITRTNGFDQPIEVRVDGLPDGVTAAVATSEPKGDTKAKLELEIVAAEAAVARSGAIRIIGSAGVDGEKVERPATAPIVRGRTQYTWLTTTAKKPDVE